MSGISVIGKEGLLALKSERLFQVKVKSDVRLLSQSH